LSPHARGIGEREDGVMWINGGSSSALSSAGLLVLSALSVPPAPVAPGSIRPGDVPQYRFHQPLVNGLGSESLSDLRGKPVLIDFWGTR
jgi:hypothetical protein